MAALSSLHPFTLVSLLYQYAQLFIAWLFAPLPPSMHSKQKPFGKVAVIGSGITGISSAAHLIGHGFEPVIFEETDMIGGIWSRVNSTSGLQISSAMYRFHPAVKWTKGYPKRDEILDNVERVWRTYDLEKRTRFNTRVEGVTRHSSSTDPNEGGHARWVINGKEDEPFDGIIVAVGTCGKPKMMKLPNQESFKGKIVHSSELDNVDLKNKHVLVVGGGASGIEALELAVHLGAKKTDILARSDKWIIPRFTIIDVLLSLQPLGRETYLSWIPELLLRKLHYRDLEEKMAPTQGFFTGTPIVNSSALTFIRQGKADYLRGDVLSLNSSGIEFNFRKRGQKKESPGKKMQLDADVIVVATGFEKPKIDFLPDDLFPEDYVRPNMYLQNFPIMDCSVVCTNSSFKDAVGTVGNWHIGIYARILMLFIMDKECRPKPRDMRLWVDLIKFIKERAPGGQLEFFTYMELVIWLVTFLFFRIQRLKYFFFVLFAFGFWSRDQVPAKGAKGRRGRAVKGQQDGGNDMEETEPRFHLSLSKLVPHYRSKVTANKSIGGYTKTHAN